MQAGQRLRIEHKYGDVVVRTHSASELTVHAVIRVSASDSNEAKRYSDQVRITVEPAGSTMLIGNGCIPGKRTSNWLRRNVSHCTVNFTKF